jgi:LPS export ABC transporter protein LptC
VPIDASGAAPRACRSSRGAAAAFLAALLGCGATASAAGPPLRIEELVFVASHEADTEVRVEARAAVIDEAANTAQLEDVTAAWAGDDGETSLHITCERGELDLGTNDLLATGDVHGLLADGRRFVGPWLRYDRARGVAFTQAPVEIFEGPRVLRGGGFEYRVRDGRLKLTSGARVVEAPDRSIREKGTP